MTRALVVMLPGLVVGGCAVGNRHAYHTVLAEPKVAGTAAVGVSTHDQRDYVRSGNKDPQFVGLERGGFGNPVDVRTKDTAIVNTLARKGFKAQAIVTTAAMAPGDVRQKLQASGAQRGVVLTLREWKADTMFNAGLVYDVTLQVLDRGGAVLAGKQLQGRDNLGHAGVPSAVEPLVARAFKLKLEELLDDPAVATALRGSQ